MISFERKNREIDRMTGRVDLLARAPASAAENWQFPPPSGSPARSGYLIDLFGTVAAAAVIIDPIICQLTDRFKIVRLL